MTTNRYNPMFRLVVRFIKYFWLMIAGFAIAYVLSALFGALPIAESILPFVFWFIINIGIILMCLMGLLIVFESTR